jgi:hypothetical protein
MAEEEPDALALVVSYLNSIDVESGRDDLSSLAVFRRWLDDHGRGDLAGRATEADLALAVELRYELREVLLAHGEGRAGGSARLDELAAGIPLRARLATPPAVSGGTAVGTAAGSPGVGSPGVGSPGMAGWAGVAGLAGMAGSAGVAGTAGVAGLAPAAEGIRGLLGEVLAAIVLADRDGTWCRLKLCREDTCQVVFYDRSKNASRCWCSMRVCGNRNKTRAYRGRQRVAT